LAIVGSILNNNFASSFMRNLPEGVKSVLTPEQLAGIVNNPQVLVSAGARTQLEQIFTGMGSQGQELFNQMIFALKSALNTALVQVFFAFLIIAVLAIITNLFLTGIPKTEGKKHGPHPEPEK
jgi:UDP-N-acetylglucosamine:LPS N-acetylglucosamine transferase